jgi:hypothetical protein
MTTWTIAQLERNTSDGGVVVAHWRAQQLRLLERYVLCKLLRHLWLYT